MKLPAVLVFSWLVASAAVDPVRAQSDVPAAVRVPPLVDVRDFGAVGDCQADDTSAIQQAIDSMTGGGTLVFPAGNYVYTKQIIVSKPGVRLWGFDGAVLHASNPDHQAIRLSADATCIYGFTLTSTATHRATQLRHHRIVLERDGSEVIDNHIIGGAASGIFAYGASNYLIAHNTVEGTLADTIHNTGNSRDGRILYNHIINGGDDGVAAIGYQGDYPRDIHVEGNIIDGNHARGLAAVGAARITFIENFVQETNGAGLLVASESSYNTYGCRDIVAQNNTFFRNNKGNKGHGAILVYVASSQCGRTVNGISLDNHDILIEANRAILPYHAASPVQVRPAECNHNVVTTGNLESTSIEDVGTLRDLLLARGAGQRQSSAASQSKYQFRKGFGAKNMAPMAIPTAAP